MNKSSLKFIKGSAFALFAIYAVMISGGYAIAEDFTMQKNLNDIADLMAKWSKQLSTGKLDPDSQGKLGEIISQASQILRDMAMQGRGDMQMEYHDKIMEMEKAWDPFDTSDRM